MERNCIIEGKILKPYDTNYYVSENGDVYSKYSKKILKHSYDLNGYPRVDIHGKHKKVHILVYETWVRKLKEGEQVNHKDDNKLNTHYSNLYVGSQKDNINDCINNNHRVGKVFYFTVLDNKTNKILTFCPASDFFDYCGHNSKNGSINRMFDKLWFKQRYTVLEYKRIKYLRQFLVLKGVTTMGDECNPVS